MDNEETKSGDDFSEKRPNSSLSSENSTPVSDGEWLTEEELESIDHPWVGVSRSEINALLTRKYGDLKAQLAEARKDSERLDAIETMGFTRITDSERYLPKQICFGKGTHRTLRQAIDKAMR